jgi:multidrug efflux pump subunit AcrB
MRASSFTILIVFTALMLAGLAFSGRLAIQLHPETDLPAFSIRCAWPDASALQIEREVTSKLEAAVSLLRGVENISSYSTLGFARIDVQFKKTTDTEMVRFELASQIRRLFAGLPEGVAYPEVRENHSLARQKQLLVYSVVSPEPPFAVNQYLESHIFPKISHIAGVDEVLFSGENQMEYKIVYNTNMLRRLQLTVNDIAEAIRHSCQQSFAGMAQLGNDSLSDYISELPVKVRADMPGGVEWEHIPVASVDGRIIYLTDVADVLIQEREPRQYYRINGRQAMLITINAESGINRMKLAKQLKNQMCHIRESLPPYWNLELTYDDTQLLRRELSRVGFRMMFSLTVLMLFVLITSGSIKYALMILLTLLANVLIAIIWYYLFNIKVHLYSLAGITVSFGIIVDNSIVMMAHLRQHGNKKVFLAILAATLTSAGSLSVIFMLSPVQQAQLSDFAAVVLANIIVSLFVAWFFIPAIFSGNRLPKESVTWFSRRLLWSVYRQQKTFLLLAGRFRTVILLTLLLIFGLPVHLLPERLDADNSVARIYNLTFGSSLYQGRLKQTSELLLGGSLRLFNQFVLERSSFSTPERTVLTINAGMPHGASIHQLNRATIVIEDYLRSYDEIEQFQTRIMSHDNATVSVFFKPVFDDGVFPHYLENQVVQKARTIGGVSWSVTGAGRGFSNAVTGSTDRMGIVLEGYNYDQLYRIALDLKERSERNPRMTNQVITGSEIWINRSSRMEFFVETNPSKTVIFQIHMPEVMRKLSMDNSAVYLNAIPYGNQLLPIRLLPDDYQELCIWSLNQKAIPVQDKEFKSAGIISVQKRPLDSDIFKNNQQYRLLLYYDFTGPPQLMHNMTSLLLEETNASSPIGYKAYIEQWEWDHKKKKDYLLIALVIVIIYFMCAILLESLLQPLAIIAIIPVSFIGLFLTFYIFNLNFDQGGLAAFILLSGLSVNAGLYILNDYNIFRKKRPGGEPVAVYLKAFYYKFFPVFLTIISTITGLLPFLIGKREVFWFAFAAGTIGGLGFSLIALCLFFPVFLGLNQKSLLSVDSN